VEEEEEETDEEEEKKKIMEEENWLSTTGNVWHFEHHTVVA